jgi:hypothetical protein
MTLQRDVRLSQLKVKSSQHNMELYHTEVILFKNQLKKKEKGYKKDIREHIYVVKQVK